MRLYGEKYSLTIETKGSVSCNVFCNARRISFQPDAAESGTQVCTLNGQKRARLSGPCGGVAFVIGPSITETEC